MALLILLINTLPYESSTYGFGCYMWKPLCGYYRRRSYCITMTDKLRYTIILQFAILICMYTHTFSLLYCSG